MKEKPQPIDPLVEAKCKRVLAVAFRGIHHCEGWDRRRKWGQRGLRVFVFGQLSTFDFDGLTRLVLAAHEECVRVVILPSGTKGLGIALTCRDRKSANIASGHDTIEQAIERFRKGLTAGGWNE